MTHASSSGDRAALIRAIALAQTVRGTTAPNPAVGCVLVRDATVVGEGATAPVGGPHAEVVALRAAGDDARGATAYVTLEPCAHHGRTPPCTDALIAAGVVRVVHACTDPNPPAAGGSTTLRRAGIAVTGPDDVGALLAGTAAAQLEGFLTVVSHGRPHVTLKLAQTADGRLDPPDGQRWITGPTARRAVHRWRAAVDAVLVGSGTVLADDPQLDAREVPAPVQPRPVVFDTTLATPTDARVVRPGLLIVTASDDDAALRGVTDGPDRPRRRAVLEAAGAQLIEVPTGPDGRVVVAAGLAALAEHGITSVLAEPGPRLAAALIAADVVDRLVLHVALGLGSGTPARAVDLPAPWRLERVGGAGPDAVLHLVRIREHDGYRAMSAATAEER